MFTEESAAIRKQARAVSYDGLEAIFKEIDELKTRLKSNVNFDVSLELLFINIRASLNV